MRGSRDGRLAPGAALARLALAIVFGMAVLLGRVAALEPLSAECRMRAPPASVLAVVRAPRSVCEDLCIADDRCGAVEVTASGGCRVVALEKELVVCDKAPGTRVLARERPTAREASAWRVRKARATCFGGMKELGAMMAPRACLAAAAAHETCGPLALVGPAMCACLERRSDGSGPKCLLSPAVDPGGVLFERVDEPAVAAEPQSDEARCEDAAGEPFCRSAARDGACSDEDFAPFMHVECRATCAEECQRPQPAALTCINGMVHDARTGRRGRVLCPLADVCGNRAWTCEGGRPVIGELSKDPARRCSLGHEVAHQALCVGSRDLVSNSPVLAGTDWTASASVAQQCCPAESAFEETLGRAWATPSVPSARWEPQYVQVESRTASVVWSYSITAGANAREFAPTDWFLLGALDGATNWQLLDSRTGVVWNASSPTATFSVPAPLVMRSYRLMVNNVTGRQGRKMAVVARLELLGEQHVFPTASPTAPPPVTSDPSGSQYLGRVLGVISGGLSGILLVVVAVCLCRNRDPPPAATHTIGNKGGRSSSSTDLSFFDRPTTLQNFDGLDVASVSTHGRSSSLSRAGRRNSTSSVSTLGSSLSRLRTKIRTTFVESSNDDEVANPSFTVQAGVMPEWLDSLPTAPPQPRRKKGSVSSVL